jgi:hypothetical protein
MPFLIEFIKIKFFLGNSKRILQEMLIKRVIFGVSLERFVPAVGNGRYLDSRIAIFVHFEAGFLPPIIF